LPSDQPNPPGEEPYHQPVLVNAVLHWILTDASGVYVDGTAGGGGHSNAILKRLNPDGRMVLIDRDEDAVELCKSRFSTASQVHVVHGDFKDIDVILGDLSITKITGFLLDLGLSSHQLDTPERGFSYSSEAELDMRMDRRLPETAADVLNTRSEKELADLFFRYGEDRQSRLIAKRIVREREKQPYRSSAPLNAVIRKTVPSRWQIKTLSRIYQALRIEVNDELHQLKTALQKAYPLLQHAGRIVVISYNSLEDRIVKQFFRSSLDLFPENGYPYARSYFLFSRLTRKVVRPSREEIRDNPRARSAKLRAAEKSASPEIVQDRT
jgi:16S rRNA (cytosine1402-N4)-methyltransferase